MATRAENQQVEQDIRLIVGGNFTSDGIGPARYQEVLGRARAAPDAYLHAFEQLYLSRPVSLDVHSNLYLPYFLSLLSDVAPARVQALAERLLRQTEAVLRARVGRIGAELTEEGVPEGTARALRRVNMRRRALRELVRPPGPPGR